MSALCCAWAIFNRYKTNNIKCQRNPLFLGWQNQCIGNNSGDQPPYGLNSLAITDTCLPIHILLTIILKTPQYLFLLRLLWLSIIIIVVFYFHKLGLLIVSRLPYAAGHGRQQVRDTLLSYLIGTLGVGLVGTLLGDLVHSLGTWYSQLDRFVGVDDVLIYWMKNNEVLIQF